MARQAGIAIENNFSQGLITEATGLNFPENACSDTDNCIFLQTGEVTRRPGINLEATGTSTTLARSGAISTFLWNNVAGEGSRNFVVLQVGDTLHFYVVGAENSLSAGKHSDTVDITTYEAPNAPNVATVECQYTSGNGLLFVTHPYLEAFRVIYDSSTDSISSEQIDLTIRDLEGVPDTLDVDERPTATVSTVDAQHHYNLLNQGWSSANLTAWDTAQTTMPSNADVPWYFKDANDAFSFADSVINNITVGNTPAAKGKFILNVYDQDRTTVSGVSGATGFSTGFQRCATCCFFAGRVFYSGLAVEEYNSRIFFSQIIEGADQYGKCHQKHDPTSELLFDLLPSDGGVIKILDAGRIIKMVPVYGQLLVFASNGVWAISGSEGLGFSATDYTVSKVSSSRTLSSSSFVDVDGLPIWWTSDGIYTLQFTNAAATPQAVSISDGKIKAFMDDIPDENKGTAKGAFNPVTRIVQWVYRQELGGNITTKYNYDRILNLNMLTGAFYPWSIDGSIDTKLNGIVTVEAFGGNLVQSDVDSDGDDVQSDGDDVVVIAPENPASAAIFKYIMTHPNGADYDFSFAEARSSDYLDFADVEDAGVDYESYFISGFKLRGDAQRKFQTNQIYIFTRGDSEQSYLFQGRWNYATSGNTGRWTTSQRVEIPAANYSYVYRKLKCRGNGIALQYKISSSEGLPFYVIGWSAFDTVNERP